MARIPVSEIERLKLEASMVRLVEAAGIALKPHGKDLVGRCPFHDDRTPSLVISPKANLWHCLGKCQMGGSPIDWVMRFEGVPFRRAVELLRHQLGTAPALDAAPRPTANAPAPERASANDVDATASMLDAMEQAPKSPGGAPKGYGRMLRAEASTIASADDQALLDRVIGFYHETLKQSPEAQAYLAARGLSHPEVVDHFKLGFANRTLGYRLPDMQVKAGAAIRGALQRIGIYRGTGHEHFNGSMTIPIFDAQGSASGSALPAVAAGAGCAGAADAAGHVVEVYGRKVGERLREGTPLHLYLPGPHRGVFNEQGLAGQQEAILCEALIDALTFWCAGYRNVTSSYGIEGFTPDILAALKRHGIRRVLIAYDRDDAGNAAAEKLASKLIADGFECYRIQFPKGMDANEYALHVQPAAKSLGLVIRQAEWIGKGTPPPREPPGVREEAAPIAAPSADAAPPVEHVAVVDVPSLVAELAAPAHPAPATLAHPCASEAAKQEIAIEPAADSIASPAPIAPAAVLPPLPTPIPCEVTARDVTIVLGDRRYRVRGLDKNLAYDTLKVNLLVSRGDAQGCASGAGGRMPGATEGLHVDTFDLYQAKARALFVRLAAVEIGVEEAIVQRDLGQVLLVLEQQQDALIQRQLKADRALPVPEIAALGPEDEAAAFALLRDPQLIERIVGDFERTGLVGEPTNALVGYLAAISRKLAAPLAILIQSTSAAGKSALMDAVLRFVPEAERVHYSAMTGQSLFYLGERDLKHKILAIAEEEGVRQAAYALKLLQSQGELTIASTGKDPATGKLVTEEYRVEGPVMLFLTTTAIDVDEELLNRCLVLTIDESREQTRAIQARQRQRRTLDGLLADTEADALATLHRHAQQLLRPVSVVNPYADRLGFLDDRTRTRRDHQKYLTLIDAIAFLHQHQRAVRVVEHRGRRIEYVQVEPADIALANRLAHEVLGRSLDELPPQTRRLLGIVRAYVAERCATLAIRQADLRFTRRELRERAGSSEAQMRLHLERLVALEYLLPHRGQRGQSFVYELIFDGDVGDAAPRLPGLIDVDSLPTTQSSRGVEGEFVGPSRAHRGGFVAGSRSVETGRRPKPDAAPGELFGDDASDARPGKPNGASRRTPVVVPVPALVSSL